MSTLLCIFTIYHRLQDCVSSWAEGLFCTICAFQNLCLFPTCVYLMINYDVLTTYRASRHPNSRVNRSPLVQRKQYIVPITTPRWEHTILKIYVNSHTQCSFLRERHLKCDVKPPVSVHAHSRPSSAKIRYEHYPLYEK